MIWLLLLPVLILIPILGQVPFQPGASYSDLLISHYPNAIFLKQILLAWRQVPLWSPLILSGYPFAANPLSGLWYPPGWLTLLFPMPYGFNLAVLIHLVWGGLGMMRWLKREGLATLPAVFGALAFESLPKLWAHIGAGHVTLIYAVAWTPWLLWAEKRRADSLAWRISLAAPGVVLGIIFLADPRWAAYTGVLWLGYMLWLEWRKSRSVADPSRRWGAGLGNSLLLTATNVIRRLPIQAGLAILIAAPLLVPLVRYAQQSTRVLMTAQDTLVLALPVERLLNLVVPDPGGYAEWILYPTAIVLILASLAVTVPVLRRKTGFWWLVVGFSLLFALGPAVPAVTYLSSLPGFDLLRVPSRSLFITGLGLAAIAAYGLDALLDTRKHAWFCTRTNPSVLAFVIAAFVILLGGVLAFSETDLPFTFAWAMGALAAAYAIAAIAVRKISPQPWIGAACLLVLIIDAGVINYRSLEPRRLDVIQAKYTDLVEYLKSQPGHFRVYSPSYSLPQDVAAQNGISLADGIDPLQLRKYTEFMQMATGVRNSAYSVTLPPFASGDPAVDNIDALPNPRMLGVMNVRYILSEYDLPGMGLDMQARFGETRVYENPYAIGDAWIQPDTLLWGMSARAVPAVHIGANEIDVVAEGSALLVLSELNYPGWKVEVDGHPAEIFIEDGLLLGVQLHAGTHRVHFVFEPWDVALGIGAAVLAWAGLLGLQIFQRQPRRAEPTLTGTPDLPVHLPADTILDETQH